MDKARWRKIRQIFLHLSGQNSNFRDNYLNTAVTDAADLRADIEAMLCAHDKLSSGAVTPPPLLANLPSTSLLGTRPGGYEIIDLIGSGGMSVVYRARRPGKPIVALKSLPRYLVQHPAARARLEREAQILDAVSHPALCAVHDVLHTDELFAVVMDFIDGQNLQQRLDSGALALPQALSVAADLAGVLSATHGLGIVHRDIKPSNVLLTRDGRTKLIDFGIAYFGNARMTHTGELLGSPAYMAPEQWNADPVDGRTDVWSLGALLYRLCCDTPPFHGDSIADRAQQVCHQPPAPWPQRLCQTEAQRALRDLTLRMLEKALANRPATMQQVLAELTVLQRAIAD